MKPATILVTDDESRIRLMLKTTLESEGYDVLEAGNGREAMDLMKQLRTPDLVVLDLNMPVLDGMAVLEEMKSLVGVRPRVIVLTAYGSIPAAVKATRLGADDFLEKPVTPTQLRQAIASVLDEPELDTTPQEPAKVSSGYEQVLDRIRKKLRMADYENAESLLAMAAKRKDQQSAEYFNLLGVLYETQHKWRLARKCYDKAIAADENYEPGRQNIRRLHELIRYGASNHGIVLGDEISDVWMAKLPENKNGMRVEP